MLNTNQIAWAARHDWFIGDNGDGTITVCDGYTINGVYGETIVVWAQSFRELRDWAGY